MLRAIDTNTEFSINELKRRMYQVTWTVKGKKVEITFPADCQLLNRCQCRRTGKHDER